LNCITNFINNYFSLLLYKVIEVKKYKTKKIFIYMGIYTHLDMYGIRIYHFIDDKCETLFAKTYDDMMTREQIGETKVVYEELYRRWKQDLRFQIYTECSSTFDEGKFMMWYPISLEQFLEKTQK